MAIGQRERNDRRAAEETYANLNPTVARDTSFIRAQALAMFTKQLDGKLRNLQDGEALMVRFRFDIVGENGKVRGGSGAERTMPEYIDWRSAVYQRDGYTCRECGAKGDLNAHHVKPWSTHPDLRFDVDNGITLCVECHAKRHPHLGFNKHRGRNQQIHN